MGLLGQAWHNLEKCINIHIAQLFLGEFPTNPREIYTRWLTRIDHSATEFASNRRQNSKNSLLLKNVAKIQCTETSKILNDYFAGMETIER
jgi:hypothetical protein